MYTVCAPNFNCLFVLQFSAFPFCAAKRFVCFVLQFENAFLVRILRQQVCDSVRYFSKRKTNKTNEKFYFSPTRNEFNVSHGTVPLSEVYQNQMQCDTLVRSAVFNVKLEFCIFAVEKKKISGENSPQKIHIWMQFSLSLYSDCCISASFFSCISNANTFSHAVFIWLGLEFILIIPYRLCNILCVAVHMHYAYMNFVVSNYSTALMTIWNERKTIYVSECWQVPSAFWTIYLSKQFSLATKICQFNCEIVYISPFFDR